MRDAFAAILLTEYCCW